MFKIQYDFGVLKIKWPELKYACLTNIVGMNAGICQKESLPRNLRYALDVCVSGQIRKKDEVETDIHEIVCIMFYV